MVEDWRTAAADDALFFERGQQPQQQLVSCSNSCYSQARLLKGSLLKGPLSDVREQGLSEARLLMELPHGGPTPSLSIQ